MADLQNPRIIRLKGFLFLVCGILAAGTLLVERPSVRTAVLLSVTIWSFCRCYYFVFYVIQHYVDAQYRFTGLWDFAKYCLQAKPTLSSAPERRCDRNRSVS